MFNETDLQLMSTLDCQSKKLNCLKKLRMSNYTLASADSFVNKVYDDMFCCIFIAELLSADIQRA